LIVLDEVQIPVQVNGKVRAQLLVNTKDTQNTEFVIAQAKTLEGVQAWIAGKKIVKEIYIPGKILNFAVTG